MKYHKHAKLIKAWANGAKIQWWNVEHRRWVDLDDSRPFSWDESIVYSIKPEEKQEPVAYKYTDKTNPLVFYFTTHKDSLPNPDVIETALYTAPPKREIDMSTKPEKIDTSAERVHETDKSVHEPVTTIETACALLRQAHDVLSMSSLPPKREWVGLTDEEMENLVGFMRGNTMIDFARAIEAKLRERNT